MTRKFDSSRSIEKSLVRIVSNLPRIIGSNNSTVVSHLDYRHDYHLLVHENSAKTANSVAHSPTSQSFRDFVVAFAQLAPCQPPPLKQIVCTASRVACIRGPSNE